VEFSDAFNESFMTRLNDWKRALPAQVGSESDTNRPCSEKYFDTPARSHWRGSYVSLLASDVDVLIPVR
jgi:hypothetical protein